MNVYRQDSPQMVLCPGCNYIATCNVCNGSGNISNNRSCGRCRGRGSVMSMGNSCGMCRGSGYVEYK